MTTKITEIRDRAACAVWSPFASHSDVVALGTKDSGGVSFDSDKGGELELYDTSVISEPTRLASVKTPTRFSSLHWVSYTTDNEEFPVGLLVGGMEDGVVNIWDALTLLKQQDTDASAALIATVSLQEGAGPVTALKTSPLDKHMLCAGASNGQVVIIDLTNPREPATAEPGSGRTAGGGVTAVAWNSQVAHIVATASGDGSVTVWDLQARKVWCEIRAEQAGQPVTDVLWNPSQGLHLLTASGDDRNPVLRVWDLRSSTSMPMATLTGHSAGLLNAAWCPHDDALLLSTAKDHRTILWDLYSLQPMGEIPLDQDVQLRQQQAQAQANNPSALFASNSLHESQNLRYTVVWSPIKRGVVLTCSLDKKVQVHSILALTTQSGRPPAWMRPMSSVSTGFGGILLSCAANRQVVVQTVQEQAAWANKVVEMESARAQQTDIDYCMSQSGHPWGFLRVVFEANARQQLLQHLEFSAEEIAAAAEKLSDELGSLSSSSSSHHGGEKPRPAPPLKRMSPQAEEIIKKALLVGNFEAAVECCFQSGSFADALLLASCGGGELWSKTQERYFAQESPKRPFLSIASAIIRNQLDELVSESDTNDWRETLAILATYGQSEEFPLLCVKLGERLEEAGDDESASNCYMCALNLEGAVHYWMKQLDAKRSTDELNALYDFVVKVSVLSKATAAATPLPEAVAKLFHEFASVLADQGLLALAAQYSQSIPSVPESGILRDRLYRSRASPRCLAAMGNVAPDYPYAMMNLTPSAGQTLASEVREQENAAQAAAAEQAAAQQQAAQAQQQQQAQYGHEQAAANSQYGQQQQQYQQTAPSDQLPTGWIALQDPGSGQTYYANQTTGETTWERPQPPAPTPAPAVTPQRPVEPSYASNGQQQQTATNPKAHLMSKYGDGFVTSASHPELASQYGNVGTSNPYGGVARPGTAAAVVNSSPAANSKAPVSGSLNFDSVQLTDDHHQAKDTLLGLAATLKGCPLNPVEKRQLSEAEKGVAILVKKLARGDIGEATAGKVYNLVAAVAGADLATAAGIQTDLANHDWRDHKDWLKGVKMLIQLGTKKL